MNEFLLIDAISCLDTDLLEKHLKQKLQIRDKAITKKKKIVAKWSTIAASLVVILMIPILLWFIRDNDIGIESEDMYYSEFFSYSDVQSIITEDTIFVNLHNIVEQETEIKYTLYHQKNDPYNYSNIECRTIVDGDQVTFYCYFNSYDENKIFFPQGNINNIELNGVSIDYCELQDKDDNIVIYARFAYKNCIYVVEAYNANFPQLEQIINALLLEK